MLQRTKMKPKTLAQILAEELHDLKTTHNQAFIRDVQGYLNLALAVLLNKQVRYLPASIKLLPSHQTWSTYVSH